MKKICIYIMIVVSLVPIMMINQNKQENYLVEHTIFSPFGMGESGPFLPIIPPNSGL